MNIYKVKSLISQFIHGAETFTPLIGLVVLLVLFIVPVKKYIVCSGGELVCGNMIEHLNNVVIPYDPNAVIKNDKGEPQPKKPYAAQERTSAIYAGRINFLFLATVYFSLSTLALVVAVVILYRSLPDFTKYPWFWLGGSVSITAIVWFVLYNNPLLYLRIFLKLLPLTIDGDFKPAGWVLTAVNSYGLAVALLLTLASCATLGRQSSGTWEERVKQIGEQMKNLRLILYVGTFMLIVGVLLIRAVFQWALAFGPREAEAIKAVDTLFSALLAAEGGYFTLVLAVVYLPAALILKHRVDSLAGEPAEQADKAKALERNNLTFSFTQSLPKIAAILGPLLAGPVGELLGRLG